MRSLRRSRSLDAASVEALVTIDRQNNITSITAPLPRRPYAYTCLLVFMSKELDEVLVFMSKKQDEMPHLDESLDGDNEKTARPDVPSRRRYPHVSAARTVLVHRPTVARRDTPCKTMPVDHQETEDEKSAVQSTTDRRQIRLSDLHDTRFLRPPMDANGKAEKPDVEDDCDLSVMHSVAMSLSLEDLLVQRPKRARLLADAPSISAASLAASLAVPCVVAATSSPVTLGPGPAVIVPLPPWVPSPGLG